MKIITIFSHKGGVGKTTSVYNIGWMLSDKYRVLLVDADSQCSLSQMFLSDNFDSYYADEETMRNNIKSGIEPVLYAQPKKEIEAVMCPESVHKKDLFLLPGSYEISEMETSLTLAMLSDVPALCNFPGALYQLIKKTAEKLNIDYVLIDMNPSLGSINRNLFLLSDGFIIPTSPDIFSKRALESLATHLPKWVCEWNRKKGTFANSEYQLPEAERKFIGQIPQRFNIRNGEATRAFSIMIKDLADEANSSLVPALANENMLFSKGEYQRAGVELSGLKISEIPNFNSLAARGQLEGTPAYAAKNIGQGRVEQLTKEQQENQRKCYEKIVSVITTLLPLEGKESS